MQVRLGFASMIQAEADIYLVDEVLAVGDARFQQKCFDTFRQLKRDRRTVVFVTHDLASVERFCDRAVLLERGEVVADGDPREVTHVYRQRDLEQERVAAAAAADAGTRWGDGRARVVEAWLEDERGARQAVLPQGRRATYRARIRFEGDMENPIFGVILKAENGEHVFVTNTMLAGVDTGSFAAGEEAVYSVALDMHLAEGRCSASPAVAHQDAQRFADWWEDGVTFAVRGEGHTGGLVDLPHETRVEPAPAAAQVGQPVDA
jgi:ABC-type uncharacterized transport system ATPase subunit